MATHEAYADYATRAWLQEPVHLPEQGRARVAELIRETPQQRHWWPAFPSRRSQQMFTGPKIVVTSLALALIGMSVVVTPELLQEPTEPMPAVVAPSASADASPEPTAEPTNAPSIAADTVAASTFAATSVIAELGSESQPTFLVPSPSRRPGAVYIDQATSALMHADDEGVLRVLMQKDSDDASRALSSEPVAVALYGSQLAVIGGDGEVRGWVDWKSAGRVHLSLAEALPTDEAVPDEPPPTEIAPAVAMAAKAVADYDLFDLYAIDETGETIDAYQTRRVDGPDETIERGNNRGDVEEITLPAWTVDVMREVDGIGRPDGAPVARDIHVDSAVYVLTSRSVERYQDRVFDPDFELAIPDGVEPDYRFLDATGSESDGQLWQYDARGERFDVYEKDDGSLIGSWMPDGGRLGDIRGMYVTEGVGGEAESVTWLTQDAVVRGALTDPEAVRPRPQVPPIAKGRLTASDRESGKRKVDWSDTAVDFKADSVSYKVMDRTVRPPRGVIVEAAMSRPDDADLEIEWREGKVDQRVNFQFLADDTHWWIGWIWVYDGDRNGEWIRFDDLEELTRTPLGESLVGDLRLESSSASKQKYDAPGTAVMRIDGLKLTTFVPGTRPAPLTGCVPFDDDRFDIERDYGWEVEEESWSTRRTGAILRGPGEPLHGMKEKGLSPREVEAVLKGLGICYRFRHEWKSVQVLPDGSKHNRYHTDFRCTAPATGNVAGLEPGPGYPAATGDAVIYVKVPEKGTRDWPTPPQAGTDCPTQ